VTETLAYGAYVTRCRKCGGDVNYLYRDDDGKAHIFPCRHAADIVVKPNPALAQADGAAS